MPEKFSAKRVINGTYGELWLDGEYVAECYKLQAKVTYTREKVPMCGNLTQGRKLVEVEGTGSAGLHKVNSRLAMLVAEEIKKGNDPRFTIVSKLDDPDAFGSERISLTGCAFDDTTLADWEAGVLGKIEAPFTFEDYEFIDAIGD